MRYSEYLRTSVLLLGTSSVALLFVFMFITFALVDTREYRAALIPGYAPAVHETQGG